MESKQNAYTIREITTEEIPLLHHFLYEAIFQKNGEPPLPKDIIFEPDIFVYIKDFGRPSDHCLIAEKEKKIVGAVWTRILSGMIRGHGNIDDKTPEFAISVSKEVRNQKIGTTLMRKMLQLLHDKGYTKASLSVQKDNFAVKMYKNVGFDIIEEREDDYIMVCDTSSIQLSDPIHE